MPEEDIEELTPEQVVLLEDAMKAYGAPQPEEKHNIHVFLNKVATSSDTTKTGNLTIEEIGITPFSLRSYKTMALMSGQLCNDDIWEKYFKDRGEILTSTSLSKDAKLLSLAVVQKRELADVTTKSVKPNSGWFKKKEGG